MLFYRIINKITQDKLEINKVFYSGVNAQLYADELNRRLRIEAEINGSNSEPIYKPDPFIYIMSEAEKEMYNKIIKLRRSKYTSSMLF